MCGRTYSQAAYVFVLRSHHLSHQFTIALFKHLIVGGDHCAFAGIRLDKLLCFVYSVRSILESPRDQVQLPVVVQNISGSVKSGYRGFGVGIAGDIEVIDQVDVLAVIDNDFIDGQIRNLSRFIVRQLNTLDFFVIRRCDQLRNRRMKKADSRAVQKLRDLRFMAL